MNRCCTIDVNSLFFCPLKKHLKRIWSIKSGKELGRRNVFVEVRVRTKTETRTIIYLFTRRQPIRSGMNDRVNESYATRKV